MDLLRAEDVATVVLFDLRLSEGELEYLAIAAKYLLDNLTDQQLHAVLNDDPSKRKGNPAVTREFLEGRYDEIVALLQEYCRPQFLPKRFRADVESSAAAHDKQE